MPWTRSASTGSVRARRHREQGPARRQRHPGRQPRRGQGRRGRQGSAAVALRRRPGGLRAAGADDERDQRRRARRQPDRRAGIHGHAGGCRELLGQPANGRRDLPQPCARRSRTPATTPMSATRAASHPISRAPTRRWRSSPGPSRPRATGWATRWCWRWTSPPASCSRTGTTRWPARAARLDAAGHGQALPGAGRALPDRVDRGRHGRGRLGRLEGADRRAGQQGAAGRRRSVRHQPGDPRAGHRQGRRQRAPGQGQPDRLA